MNSSDIDKKLDRDLQKEAEALTALAVRLHNNKPYIKQTAAVLTGIFKEEPYIAVDTIIINSHGHPDFKIFEKASEALEILGVPLESWKTSDYPEAKNRDFKANWNGIGIRICLYASDSSSCRVVEDGVETVTKYRLECD